jgi:peptidoglycan/xylan/chitin deacetylase (PgdA/CDA1 family)/thymidylate kinase
MYSIPVAVPSAATGPTFQRRVLAALADALSAGGHRWAVLHGWEGLPDRWSNDLDVCVEPAALGAIPGLLRRLARQGVVPSIASASGVDEIGIVLRDEADPSARAHVDLATGVEAAIWVEVIGGSEALADCREAGGVPVVSAGVHFATLLVKRIDKRTLSDEQLAALERALTEAGAAGRGWAARLLGGEGERACGWIERGEGDLLRGRLAGWRRRMIARALARRPLWAAGRRLRDLARIAGRFRDPTGLSVAVLGPDGSGKSTVVRGLARAMSAGFFESRVRHLRPGVLPDLRVLLDPRLWRSGRPPPPPVFDPHAGAPSGSLGSALRLGWYALDYLGGYPGRVLLPSARNALVLFDRYHFDLAVDPLRWRMALSDRVRRAVVRLLPRPGLVVVLDGEIDEMRRRKPELPPDELARQRAGYARLALTERDFRLVSTSAPEGEVVAEVRRELLRAQLGRALRRLDDDPAASRLPVLCYHGVGLPPDASRAKARWGIAPERLARDLADLRGAGFALRSLASHDPLGGRQVVLSFDDGLETDHGVVLPLLSAAQATATFFVISRKVGARGYLSVAALRELAAAGMEIGAHSTLTRPLTGLPLAEAREAMRASKLELEDLLGVAVRHFAFPGGKHDEALVEAAYRIGFARAATTEWRHAAPGLGDYLVPRCPIGNGLYRVRGLDVALGSPGFVARALALGAYAALRRRHAYG